MGKEDRKSCYKISLSSPSVSVGDLQRICCFATKQQTACVEDSRLRLSGMTPLSNNKAFTLIELLVVVLIIGILAAVALPQYKLAVAKSRVSTIIPVGKAIWEAKEAYYLANNEYVRDIDVLGLDVPTNCTPFSNFSVGYYRCGKYFLLDNNRGGVALNYCPEYLDDLAVCREHQDFRLVWSSLHLEEGSLYQSGVSFCAVHNNSKLGHAICKNLNGFTYAVSGEGLGRAGL